MEVEMPKTLCTLPRNIFSRCYNTGPESNGEKKKKCVHVLQQKKLPRGSSNPHSPRRNTEVITTLLTVMRMMNLTASTVQPQVD